MRMTRGRLWLVLLIICLGLAGAGAGTLLLNAETSGAAGAIADLTFEDSEGNSVSLADFRGKAVLLNVWATWCPPCREEMPSLDRLQAELGGPDFEVVPLSIDRNGLDAVRPFFAEIGIENLDIYLDQPAASMKALNVLGLPTTLLIDSSGRELQRWAGPKEWDSPEVIAEIRGYLDPTDTSSRSGTASQ
ncbi:TlpA family protein disulfide reductase [Afifella sp. H1R]|uniref:Thiol-disulfide isomerase or thioredoxin n=1 Tax=Consotaella salsifontis TaxID=1365950 RepID=A0A1T4TCW7_9HYPH|nr:MULTISPECIES: TlpA disulfide reductase family protein [Hyphomicrobiales]MCF1506005.1 TlpA family protein disulfide reductase [Afifella sp. H1R]SKA38365.1 Thiol-disulfide isomerase or thioredoxin [Consotaella salsifontis]